MPSEAVKVSPSAPKVSSMLSLVDNGSTSSEVLKLEASEELGLYHNSS